MVAGLLTPFWGGGGHYVVLAFHSDKRIIELSRGNRFDRPQGFSSSTIRGLRIMDKTIELTVWGVWAEKFTAAEADVRKVSVGIVEAINAETSPAAKCAARAGIENHWLTKGMAKESKNKAWARLIESSFNSGLALAPFVYPMPSDNARAKKARTAREKNASAIAMEATIKAIRETAKAADAAHSKALGGIRKMISDRAKNCVLEIVLQRVLAAFDEPVTVTKAKRKAAATK